VLEDAEAEGVDRWLLGGDYGTPSPWPLETLDRLRSLENATWIRGNGERWLREPPLDRPEVMEVYELFAGGLPDDMVDWLYGLPPQAELDGVLYVHGSRCRRRELRAAGTGGRGAAARRCAGPPVVFGHSHQQFRRPGPTGTELLNPGSVGMPLDGDRRGRLGDARRTASSASAAPSTTFGARRDAYRALGGPFGEMASAGSSAAPTSGLRPATRPA
jgi:hypothetical protein